MKIQFNKTDATSNNYPQVKKQSINSNKTSGLNSPIYSSQVNFTGQNNGLNLKKALDFLEYMFSTKKGKIKILEAKLEKLIPLGTDVTPEIMREKIKITDKIQGLKK